MSALDAADSQQQAPYLDALRAHAALSPARYNVPGHKASALLAPELRSAFGELALAMDIPPIVDGIDAGDQPTPFERAQRLAARAWGARRTWFLANGASAANHAICLALAHIGGEVVVQRNVHTSTIDGLIVSGLRPTFAVPEVDPHLGIAHCLTPAELDRALRRADAPSAAIVVSPTYYGFSADLAGLREVASAHGVVLVVDEAWGAHFAFSPALPQSALAAGADLVVSSTHKMLGSLTQSAMLHAGPSAAIDDATIDRAVSLLESTSPSALLAGSLDAARRHAVLRGPQLLATTIAGMRRVRAEIADIDGLAALDDGLVGRFGIAGFDPLRLTIDVSASDHGGGAINRHLNQVHGVFIELIAERVLVAIFGMGEIASDGARLVAGLRDALTTLSPESDRTPRSFGLPDAGPLEHTPGHAYFAPAVAVPARAAAGQIAAETLAVYPPGIPNVLPGERITEANLSHVLDARARGLTVRGPSDRSLETIRVLSGG